MGIGIGFPILSSWRLAREELPYFPFITVVSPLALEALGCCTSVREAKGWYLEKRRRKRGRVAATLPMIIPMPGSTEDRIASSAVASLGGILVSVFE